VTARLTYEQFLAAKDRPMRCGYFLSCSPPKKRCESQAVNRNATEARCSEHGGHHDYTERWNGVRWVARRKGLA
jgi:hypothetical protein